LKFPSSLSHANQKEGATPAVISSVVTPSARFPLFVERNQKNQPKSTNSTSSCRKNSLSRQSVFLNARVSEKSVNSGPPSVPQKILVLSEGTDPVSFTANNVIFSSSKIESDEIMQYVNIENSSKSEDSLTFVLSHSREDQGIHPEEVVQLTSSDGDQHHSKSCDSAPHVARDVVGGSRSEGGVAQSVDEDLASGAQELSVTSLVEPVINPVVPSRPLNGTSKFGGVANFVNRKLELIVKSSTVDSGREKIGSTTFVNLY
jgi:hypothetical protein